MWTYVENKTKLFLLKLAKKFDNANQRTDYDNTNEIINNLHII